MFNRSYTVLRRAARSVQAAVTLAYTAPDVVPSGARFERTLAMGADTPGFTVTSRTIVTPGADAAAQRALRYDSFNTRGTQTIDERTQGGVAFFYPQTRCVAIVAWAPRAVENAQLIPQRTSTILRLRFAPGEQRTRYLLEPAADFAAAQADLLKERTIASAKR
jgi:hypothetical protein